MHHRQGKVAQGIAQFVLVDSQAMQTKKTGANAISRNSAFIPDPIGFFRDCMRLTWGDPRYGESQYADVFS